MCSLLKSHAIAARCPHLRNKVTGLRLSDDIPLKNLSLLSELRILNCEEKGQIVESVWRPGGFLRSCLTWTGYMEQAP